MDNKERLLYALKKLIKILEGSDFNGIEKALVDADAFFESAKIEEDRYRFTHCFALSNEEYFIVKVETEKRTPPEQGWPFEED